MIDRARLLPDLFPVEMHDNTRSRARSLNTWSLGAFLIQSAGSIGNIAALISADNGVSESKDSDVKVVTATTVMNELVISVSNLTSAFPFVAVDCRKCI